MSLVIQVLVARLIINKTSERILAEGRIPKSGKLCAHCPMNYYLDRVLLQKIVISPTLSSFLFPIFFASSDGFSFGIRVFRLPDFPSGRSSMITASEVWPFSFNFNELGGVGEAEDSGCDEASIWLRCLCKVAHFKGHTGVDVDP